MRHKNFGSLYQILLNSDLILDVEKLAQLNIAGGNIRRLRQRVEDGFR